MEQPQTSLLLPKRSVQNKISIHKFSSLSATSSTHRRPTPPPPAAFSFPPQPIFFISLSLTCSQILKIPNTSPPFSSLSHPLSSFSFDTFHRHRHRRSSSGRRLRQVGRPVRPSPFSFSPPKRHLLSLSLINLQNQKLKPKSRCLLFLSTESSVVAVLVRCSGPQSTPLCIQCRRRPLQKTPGARSFTLASASRGLTLPPRAAVGSHLQTCCCRARVAVVQEPRQSPWSSLRLSSVGVRTVQRRRNSAASASLALDRSPPLCCCSSSVSHCRSVRQHPAVAAQLTFASPSASPSLTRGTPLLPVTAR